MAPKIYLTIGISGSGKSKFAKVLAEATKSIEINADNIRKSLGDISSQENNFIVWKEVDRRTIANLAGGENVILSNTNLHLRGINELRKKFPFNEINLFIMDDSTNVDLCKERVKKDLENGVERSDVPMEVIDKQFMDFTNLILELRKGLPDFTKAVVVKSDFSFEPFEVDN